MMLLAARQAQGASLPRIDVEGACPSAEQVASALTYLLKGGTAIEGTRGSELRLRVDDLGATYRVDVGGDARDYSDDARDCPERARVAAVFAAVTMEPPEVSARSKTTATAPPTVASGKESRRLQVRVGGSAEASREDSREVLGWGGELRAALVGQRWGVEMGAGGQTPADVTWGSYQARITRFVFDAGARVTGQTGALAAGASVGLAASVFRLQGQGAGLTIHDSGTRLDLGARLALFMAWRPDGKISPFVDLHASLWPRRYAVVVDGVGQVGNTPAVWVGATLGVAVRVL